MVAIDEFKGNKRILKNTGLLYVRQLFTLFISLYTTRLTLQALGETDLGVYAAVAGFTALLSTLTSSLATGTQRFITFELGRGNLEQLNRVYCTSINIHIILSLLLIVVGEAVGSWFIFTKMSVPPERLWTAFAVFQLTIFNTALALINTPNNAEIVAHEDMGTFGLISIIDAVLKCIFVSCLFFINWNRLFFYALLLFISQFINRVICLTWCKRKYKETQYKFIWDKGLIKSMLLITGWTGLNNLAVTGFIQGANLLLNVFFGPVLNAAYTLAMQAYSGIRQFCSSFQLASNPQIVKLYASGEIKKMKNLIYSVCKMSFYLIFTLSLPFAINVHFIMDFWLEDVPNHTESFFVLLLIYAYLDVLVYPLDVAAQATGKLKLYSLLVSISVLSSLVLSYAAFTFNAMPESIYIIAIVMSFVTLYIRLLCLKKIIGISVAKFVKEILLKSIEVAVLSIIIPLLIHYYASDTLYMVVINFVFSFISTITVVYFIGLTSIEKALMSFMISSIRKNILNERSH